MALAFLTDRALADRISLRVWAAIDSSDGIFVAPFEQGEIGPDLFCAACNMGLEGLVSKRGDRPYQGGRSKHWIKVKNRSHPAMERVKELHQRKQAALTPRPTLSRIAAQNERRRGS